jgi:hypothetical protein
MTPAHSSPCCLAESLDAPYTKAPADFESAPGLPLCPQAQLRVNEISMAGMRDPSSSQLLSTAELPL